MPISRRQFLLASAVPLLAQDPKFSVDVNVVTVLATVRDSQGHLEKDLAREDFTLLENGVPQKIAYFARESNLPLTIGLLVDTSRSQKSVLEKERSASYQFLDQVLRADDVAFVAHFDIRVEVLQGFTSSREELRAALQRLKMPGMISTLLFAAVRRISDKQMRPRAGRKAYIILSDGVSAFDHDTIGNAIEAAQRADTIIYSILFSDARRFRGPAPRGRQGRAAMQRMARETGGAYFEVTDDQPIEKIYADIEDELRNQYSIGYTPQSTGKSGPYRKIRLSANRPGLTVQARDGYYAK